MSDADDMLRELELKVEDLDVLIAELAAEQINSVSEDEGEAELRSLRERRARFQAAAGTLKAAIAARNGGA